MEREERWIVGTWVYECRDCGAKLLRGVTESDDEFNDRLDAHRKKRHPVIWCSCDEYHPEFHQH